MKTMSDRGEQVPEPTRWRRMRPAVRWGLVTVWLGWAACAVALLLIVFYDVKSVVVTGPIIAVIGIASVPLGIRGKYAWALLVGVANCAICLLFWMLVLTLDWSPQDAHVPFAVMGLAYTLATLPLAIRATRRAPASVSPWICVRCGYLLYGLSEPRCPECGTPFDPALVPPSPDPSDEALSRKR